MNFKNLRPLVAFAALSLSFSAMATTTSPTCTFTANGYNCTATFSTCTSRVCIAHGATCIAPASSSNTDSTSNTASGECQVSDKGSNISGCSYDCPGVNSASSFGKWCRVTCMDMGNT
jgi:hypothetical protein